MPNIKELFRPAAVSFIGFVRWPRHPGLLHCKQFFRPLQVLSPATVRTHSVVRFHITQILSVRDLRTANSEHLVFDSLFFLNVEIILLRFHPPLSTFNSDEPHSVENNFS